MAKFQLVITAEHASPTLPEPYKSLHPPKTKRYHWYFDRNSDEMAKLLSKKLRVPTFYAPHSRILVDPNRSPTHPNIVPKKSFGWEVSFNKSLSEKEKEMRITKHWKPHFTKVHNEIKKHIKKKEVLHLAIHSFVKRLKGKTRDTQIGILFNPDNKKDKEIATQLQKHLRNNKIKCKLNYPYRGYSYGIDRYHIELLKKQNLEKKYSGIALEFQADYLDYLPNRLRLANIISTFFLKKRFTKNI